MEDGALRFPRITPRRALGLLITLVLTSLWILPRDDVTASWGKIEPQVSGLVGGLDPWPERVNVTALSPLGEAAELAFALGYEEAEGYWDALGKFVEVSFPAELGKELKSSIGSYRDGVGVAWDERKIVWQTDKSGAVGRSKPVKSWKEGEIAEEGWVERLVSDANATLFVREHFGGSRIEYLFHALPSGILRADLLRYLFLLTSGGIYTDTDTHLLRSPRHWGQNADVHQPSLSAGARARLDAGEDVNDVLGKPSVIVGVEADVGEREDWQDWWAKPLQIVQWTIASAPHHPIMLQAVLRIAHQTAKAVEWVKEREENDIDDDATVLSEPRDGGPIGVVNWTGPGVFTDAVLAYLQHQYGVHWVDLKGLKKPLRIGDVVVLPVTGFSPGVGQFGAGEQEDPEAMVWHLFRGSWKSGSPAFNGDKLAADAW